MKFADGSSTGVTLAIGGNIESYESAGSDSVGAPTAGDALTWFPANTINLNGDNDTSANLGQYATFTFTGLNPSGLYRATLYGNRGASTAGSRIDTFQILNAASFTNTSSSGTTISTTTMTNDSTTYCTGLNPNGYVAQWSNIVPTNGSFELEVLNDTTVYYNYQYGDTLIAFNGMRLDLMSVPEPSALVLTCIGLVSLLAYAWRKRR